MITEKDIIEIVLSTIPEEVDFAFVTSDIKSKKNNTANTWQSGRSEFKKFTDLFPGDLAKNIVRYAANKRGIEFLDYDRIRTDNFQYNDKFDLSISNKFIEVKSSIEKYNNAIVTLINSRRFMIYPDREISDIIFQVFYIFEDNEGKFFFIDMEKLSDIEYQVKYSINSKKTFVDNFIKYAPKGCIMGFITKEIALKKKNEIFNYSNSSVQGDKARKYIDFFIKDGIPFNDLKHYL
ncbi:hypothetical protein EZS27_011335 [termite gut metagenome]|uniref:Uncharacterized protein n=1 Tax=termite gut metagenome TaxID=433724 RepID=A0A5J4S3M9_9ZZZZ